MKKRILSITLALCLVFSLLPVTALADDAPTSGTCGDNLTWVLADDGTLTISGEGAMRNRYYLSQNAEGQVVTSAPWGEYYKSIKSVVIEDGVTSISDNAFHGCSSLTSVTLPGSITSVGNDAFFGCSSIKNVYYNGDISSWLEISFDGAYANPCCHGASLYFNGELVTKVVIPNGVTSIGDEAFSGCDSLTSVTIPSSVTSIGDYAFAGCDSLTSVAIPDSVTSIGSCAFELCDSLASVTIGSGVTNVGESVFSDCGRLTIVSISNGVTSIGVHMFSGCSKLTSITIPNSVTSIGDCAFARCKSLTSVTIGNGVKSISNSAFRYINDIENVYYTGDVSSWLEISFDGDDANPCCYGASLYFNGELVTDVIIPDSITGIGSYAFYRCSSLTSVTIPDSVMSIGDEAFYGCGKLEDVAFGGTKEAWQTIGYSFSNDVRMHYNCASLEEHYMPYEITEPSCTSAGYIKYCCTCGYEYTEIVPEQHSYAFSKTVAPTCTKHGYDLFACSKCGAEKKEYKDDKLLEHSYQITVVKPTCLTGGYTLHKCSVCGDLYRDEFVQPLGHSEAGAEAKAPTCTETGRNAGTCCSRCGKVISGMGEIPALGHSYKNGSCTRCGAVDPNYIAVPTLSITTSSGKPKISWNAVDGATKYWVYRSTDGKKFKYYDKTTKTSYTNSSTTIGTTYYYKVKAVKTVNGKDIASDYSTVKSIKCAPAAPSLSISRSNGKPKLSWKAVSGATKYWIYRSTDGKNFKYYDMTTKTSYTNTGAASGTKYYYKVKAVKVVNGNNVASAYSSTKNLLTTLATPSVSIMTSNGKPKVTWSAVKGADKYYVYRSTDGKNFSYYDTTTKTSYTNTGAKKNTKYYYKIRAVCASNSYANSYQSKTVSIRATK